MNAITTTTAAHDEQQLMRVLQNSLYPGAKPESIALVLSYCRVQGIDPMLKPVHIVPTNVKIGPDKYEWRDVLMPGIADYRIKAARSGQYGGKSEPEFGPEVSEKVGDKLVTYPAWCRVTVRRIVQGDAREFSATERWLENYATAGSKTDTPNRMWLKRPYGQLAKCAEAQALRMAFPEFSGGYTAEEMEGKTGDFTGPTIDAEPVLTTAQAIQDDLPTEVDQPYPFMTPNGGSRYQTAAQWQERWDKLIRDCGRIDGGMDKLQRARDMNAPAFADVESFDAKAVAVVRTALDTALAPAAEWPTDADAANEPERADA